MYNKAVLEWAEVQLGLEVFAQICINQDFSMVVSLCYVEGVNVRAGVEMVVMEAVAEHMKLRRELRIDSELRRTELLIQRNLERLFIHL